MFDSASLLYFRAVLARARAIALFALGTLVLMGCAANEGVNSGDSVVKSKPVDHHHVLSYLKKDQPVVPDLDDWHPVSLVYNREAIIPPQCYTKTEGQFNPCYVCHQNALPERENVMNDLGLQVAYSFSDLGTQNHWQNLFEDRSQAVAAISDSEILAWVNEDNYSPLASRLVDAGFKGWVPDLNNLQHAAKAFDEQGFAKDGSWWVAFNYKPFPSTFWPTNGSTDDVMIRLAPKFYTDATGQESRQVYLANLSILEANMKGLLEITTPPLDEQHIGRDLNGDGKLATVTKISQFDQYVGAAMGERIETFLYPQGTEFLHTVRYLGFDEKGDITQSQRMKEVRYMKKWRSYTKPVYAREYQLEAFEKEVGNLPGYHNLGHNGLDNGAGWSIVGFIEDRQGQLRANTYEENLFCMGCHNSIGSTIDKTFSFARKVDGVNGWGYLDLKGMQDAPNMGDVEGEILTYFKRVGGGDEFRNNTEMLDRWFHPDGSVNVEKVKQAADVYELITPSQDRALQLNKAYKLIVQDQDFIFGRDAIVTSPKNVYQTIDNTQTPTLDSEFVYQWDIRLDWQLPSTDQHASLETQ